MRAGFKRSRTRARVYSLYFRSLCPRWEHHRSVEKLEKLFLRERRGEQIFRRIFFFFFHRRSIWTIWKEKENGEGRILSGTRLDCSLPPPLPLPPSFLGKPKRFLFHPPRIATTTLARERPLPLLPFIPFSPPPPPPPSGLSALSAPSPPRFFPSGYWTTFGRSEGAGRDL